MNPSDAIAIADRLHSVAIHLLRRVRRVDEQSGLTAARLSALSVIVYGGPLTIGQLAAAEQVRSPTITRIVDQLVDAGLAERAGSPDDARRTLVRGTPEGERVITEGRRRRVAVLADDLAALPPEDLATLQRAAEILVELLEIRHH